MLPGEITKVDEALLRTVCREHWPESQTLDFKRALPGTDDKSRHEFLKDVCAFANGCGGDLVYGVQEQHGHAGHLVPMSDATDPIDATRRRLSQLVEGGLEPRLEGVIMQSVVLAGGYALIVRVPASFQRPHRYRTASSTRWVVRVDTHTVDLTYEQIRDAFDRSATLAERARHFRDGRLTGVASRTTSHPLRVGPVCVVQLVPLAAVAGKVSLNIRDLYHRGYLDFRFDDWGAGTARMMNLEGLVVHPSTNTADLAYTQLFRTGSMETARYAGALFLEDERYRNSLPSGVISGLIRDGLFKFFDATRRFNINGPAIVAAALLGVGDRRFWYQPRNYFARHQPADRPNIILPEMWVEQLGAIPDPDEIVRPLLDMLWQAFDMEGCMFYDAQGNWAMH